MKFIFINKTNELTSQQWFQQTIQIPLTKYEVWRIKEKTHGSIFNNCPTRCDLSSLLHFCRQLYMFQVLIPFIRSLYNCNYSFWYWLTQSTTIQSCCSVGTDSCVSYNTHESFPTQQREWMVVDPVNQYQKL